MTALRQSLDRISSIVKPQLVRMASGALVVLVFYHVVSLCVAVVPAVKAENALGPAAGTLMRQERSMQVTPAGTLITQPVEQSVDPQPRLQNASGLQPSFSESAAPHDNNAEEQVTLVLVNTKNDCARLPLQLMSLAKFAQNGTIHEFLTVVPHSQKALYAGALEGNESELWDLVAAGAEPGEERQAVHDYVAAWRRSRSAFPIRVLTDEEVLPTSHSTLCSFLPPLEAHAGGRGCGYRKQMLLKIGAARHVKTRFYVTLDYDVLAKRPFGFADLVAAAPEKLAARVQGEKSGRTHHSSSWWDAAVKILDAGKCRPGPNNPTIGVTPAVLPTEVALWLMDRIPTIWGNIAHVTRGSGDTSAVVQGSRADPWDLLLFGLLGRNRAGGSVLDWSEYTLLFVSACAMGRPELFATSEHGAATAAKRGTLYEWYDGDEVFHAAGESEAARQKRQQQDISMRVGFGHGAVFNVVQGIRSSTAAVELALRPALLR